MSPTSKDLAALVGDFCEQRFAQAIGIADRVRPVLAAERPRRDQLAIEEHCAELLRPGSQTPLAGAGVVVAPHLLDGDPYCLEWWQVGDDALPCRLTADVDPASASFRDYTSLAWFDVPRRTGGPCVTGPYVDYLCTDQYTLTFTTPILEGERFLGVAGVDVLARWFDFLLLPPADGPGYDEDLVVVNASGRVLASTGPDWVTGDLIRDLAKDAGPADAEPAGWEVTPCPGTPFVVARGSAT